MIALKRVGTAISQASASTGVVLARKNRLLRQFLLHSPNQVRRYGFATIDGINRMLVDIDTNYLFFREANAAAVGSPI